MSIMITIIKIKRQIALFIILGSNVLMAQNNGFSGGSGHFYTGISSMNLQTVNDFMQSVQLPSFGNTCLNIGGGGFGMFNSFMIGGEGGAIVASSVSNANGEGSLGVGFGMFNIGYAIPSKSRFLMYPLIGMGWKFAEPSLC